jgi:orotate phosphoribosyltransferase
LNSLDLITASRSKRSQRLQEILQHTGALREGHFALKSGRHSAFYVNKDAVYPYVRLMSEIARMVEYEIVAMGWKHPEVVAGPEKGGIILAQWVATALCYDDGRWSAFQPKAVYCEKQPDGSMAFQRGYDKLLKGRRVLLVEDIVTTGGSLAKALQAAVACGGEIVGAIALVDRSTDGSQVSEKFSSLTQMQIETYPADDCPLCATHVPINTDVGHGGGGR